jgi:hypothetical protein
VVALGSVGRIAGHIDDVLVAGIFIPGIAGDGEMTGKGLRHGMASGSRHRHSNDAVAERIAAVVVNPHGDGGRAGYGRVIGKSGLERRGYGRPFQMDWREVRVAPPMLIDRAFKASACLLTAALSTSPTFLACHGLWLMGDVAKWSVRAAEGLPATLEAFAPLTLASDLSATIYRQKPSVKRRMSCQG